MEKTCKNCGHHFEGQFCPNCGQKYIDQRITLKESMNWALNSIFNLDRGFLFTTVKVLKHPGMVVKDILNGITIRYTHPFRFIFIWASISALIGISLGTFQDTSAAFNEAIGISEETVRNGQKFQAFLGNYMSFVILSMIPFYSLSTKWLFKSKGLHYAEHLVMNAYAMSSSIFVGLPMTILYYYYHHIDVISYANFVIGAVIISRVYTQTMGVKFYQAFLKYIVAFFLTILLFSVVLLVLIVIFILFIKIAGFENPFKPV